MFEEITIFTLGSGYRRDDQIVAILQDYKIKVVVDVRTEAVAENNPQSTRDTLRTALEEEGLEYYWAGQQLGGNRVPRHDSFNTALDDELRGYADYMASTDYQIGLRQFIDIAYNQESLLLFYTRLPDKCHRMLVADALTIKGLTVVHIIDEEQSRTHELSPALRRDSSELVYDNVVAAKHLH